MYMCVRVCVYIYVYIYIYIYILISARMIQEGYGFLALVFLVFTKHRAQTMIRICPRVRARARTHTYTRARAA